MKTTVVFLVLGLLALSAAAQSTVAVGNCRPHLVSYETISDAINAATPNSTVLVCPATYPEQVTITEPLTLRGLSLGGVNPVIAVPSGGLLSNLGAAVQLSVQSASGPVNIYNLTVDGEGSNFDCSPAGASLSGIEYLGTSGSLVGVNVQNQNPGGCGIGISLSGSPSVIDTVNMRQSSVTNFDDIGISATYDDFNIGFVVNLDGNRVSSASTSVYAGVYYEGPNGVVANETITVSGQYGLMLENFFGRLTARGNTVIGAGVGIRTGADLARTTDIVGNIVAKSGVGIQVISPGAGAMMQRNSISFSSVAAIDANCSELVLTKNNFIFYAPVGLANIPGEEVGQGNVFDFVPIETTPCLGR